MPQNFHSVRHLSISETQAGQRIDNFLFNQLHGVPKSRVYRILRSGEVRINKGRIKPSYRLQAGDNLRIPPIRLEDRPKPKVSQSTVDWLDAAILHEDEDLLVLNKPAGFPVHSGSNHENGVVDVLQKRAIQRAAQRIANEGLPESKLQEQAGWPQLIHRLDLETSGILLLAQNRKALIDWQDNWGEVTKTYKVLVLGRWRGGRVTLPLKRMKVENAPAVVVANDGQHAATQFEPLKTFANCTLLRAQLETGRMHQIRVHAAASGHPVLGDPRYGDFEQNRAFRRFGLKRMFLHAANIESRGRQFLAPIGAELQQVLDHLE